MLPMAAACTPGNSRARCTAANMIRFASAGSFLISEKSISVTRTPLDWKPGSSPLAASAPRKKRPALKSSMRESAICAMTEMWRGAKKRLQTPRASGFADLLFEIVHEIRPGRFQSRPQTEERVWREAKEKGDREHGRVRPEIEDEGEIQRAEERAKERSEQVVAPDAQEQTGDSAADQRRSKPSHSNCRTMRQREAPSARRSAISLFRAVPRASSMFARFKLAMSNTAPAIAMSSVPMSVTGPSSSGEVLILKRDGG